MALMDGGDFFKLGTQQASRLFVNPSMGHEAIVQAGPQGTLSSGDSVRKLNYPWREPRYRKTQGPQGCDGGSLEQSFSRRLHINH